MVRQSEALSSDQLKERAAVAKKALNARLREHYRYARRRGFSAIEARLLSFKSLDEIDRIAKERGA